MYACKLALYRALGNLLYENVRGQSINLVHVCHFHIRTSLEARTGYLSRLCNCSSLLH